MPGASWPMRRRSGGPRKLAKVPDPLPAGAKQRRATKSFHKVVATASERTAARILREADLLYLTREPC